MVGDARQEITVEGSSRRRSLGGGGVSGPLPKG